jgi:hypothetical protein
MWQTAARDTQLRGRHHHTKAFDRNAQRSSILLQPYFEILADE